MKPAPSRNEALKSKKKMDLSLLHDLFTMDALRDGRDAARERINLPSL